MKILRMINKECKELYVIRTEDDILWFSEPWDVIKMDWGRKYEDMKTIYIIDFNAHDKVRDFNTLWNDTGSTQDIYNAFENLWASAFNY